MYKLVNGQRVEMTQEEEAAITERQNRASTLQTKRLGFRQEAATRAAAHVPEWDTPRKVDKVLGQWDVIAPVATASMKTAKSVINYYHGTAIPELGNLSTADLGAVDPALDDPFTNTSVNPGPWPA